MTPNVAKRLESFFLSKSPLRNFSAIADNEHIDEVLIVVASISQLCTEVKIIDITIFITLLIFKLLLLRRTVAVANSLISSIFFLKKLASPINFKRISRRNLILANY